MKVTIEGLNHQGSGIGKVDGKVMFVPNSLPGEVVEVELTKENKKLKEGSVKQILTASSSRISPICPYFGSCGGCDLMHMKYQDQLKYKEEKVKDLVQRFAHLDSSLVKEIIASPSPLHYRNKATFQVKETIGYFGKKSYEIIPIDGCFLVDERINQVLNVLTKMNLDGVKQVVVRVSETEVLVQLLGDYKGSLEVLRDLADTVLVNDRVLFGAGELKKSLLGKSFYVSPRSFFQVNDEGTKLLYQLVKEQLEGTKEDLVLDLYCGTGTIGLFVSDVVKKVIGVELNPDAVLDAKRNQVLNQVSNMEFYVGDTGMIVSQHSFGANKVIVDPPRSGLDQKTRDYLLKYLFERIIYVSCDPMTLCRDLDQLKEQYEVLQITPVDLFSQTYHVECVAVLKRRK